MARIQSFEFMDMPWYPSAFRRIQTDYLQFAASLGSGHQNLIPLFRKALRHGHTAEIVDLCSGGAGPWKNLKKQLEANGLPVTVQLTDKYPDPESIKQWSDESQAGITYVRDSIDATNVPDSLAGMRTLFEGFHHFRPQQARSILQDAVKKGRAIGIFEASLKPPWGTLLLILSPLITFLTYLLITPLLRPVTFSRLFWTYIVPVVPLATCWDGVVSLLRVYSVEELRELTHSLDAKRYSWEIGQASTGTPVFLFTYLIGYPDG